MMGALIVTALTGVMMLVGEFGGGYWNNYYAGVEGWISLGARETVLGFLVIAPMAIGMFYLSWSSLRGMRQPYTVTQRQLRTGFYISLTVGVIILLLGVAWAVYSISEDFNDWWLSEAFYGGAIGGFIGAVIFNQARKQAEAQGIPPGTIGQVQTHGGWGPPQR